MDADYIESQRDQFLSRREKRWSMNSQRLEEIVAKVMRTVSDDGRRSFDTDLSALLEEYLTEAGLHALDAAEDGEYTEMVEPNFPEIALLLQQSAHIYGRKVDFLYRHVLEVSDTLTNSIQGIINASTSSEEPQTPSASRRKRKASAHEFAAIELEGGAHAAREADAPRPPPTLPRMYIELEPRVMTPADAPLYDYAGEHIGLVSDFQVTWRLHGGLLVDELEGGAAQARARPLSLLELQAALAAAAPRELSPLRDLRPLGTSTPLPPASPCSPAAPADADAKLLMPPPARRDRKRRNEVHIDDIFKGNLKIVFGKDLMRKLKKVQEFCVPEKWITNIVEKRKSEILSARKSKLHEPQPPDEAGAQFAGWSGSEAALAMAAFATLRAAADDSDDDGFFELSSGGGDLGTLDSLRADVGAPDARARRALLDEELAAWRANVLRRAAAAEARGGLDVRALAARLLRGLRGARAAPKSFRALLAEQAEDECDVSRLMLTTLFLANAGNVEIVSGPPLSLNSFSLRLVSSDAQQVAAAAADEQFLR